MKMKELFKAKSTGKDYDNGAKDACELLIGMLAIVRNSIDEAQAGTHLQGFLEGFDAAFNVVDRFTDWTQKDTKGESWEKQPLAPCKF